MSSFTLTQKAKFDLKLIASHTQKEWGVSQRNIYIKQFDDTFQTLADNPNIGVSCDFIKANYQKFPCSNHMIYYYSIDEKQIVIVRILHQRMDAESKFQNT